MTGSLEAEMVDRETEENMGVYVRLDFASRSVNFV